MDFKVPENCEENIIYVFLLPCKVFSFMKQQDSNLFPITKIPQKLLMTESGAIFIRQQSNSSISLYGFVIFYVGIAEK